MTMAIKNEIQVTRILYYLIGSITEENTNARK